MEAQFLSNQYCNKDQRETLSKNLMVTEKQVKIWFQNRRMRERRKTGVTRVRGSRGGRGERGGRGRARGQGRGQGRGRGRGRGRQPIDHEIIFMSPPYYQGPESPKIEEYVSMTEMSPERPASVVILDERQDNNSYEEATDRYDFLLHCN